MSVWWLASAAFVGQLYSGPDHTPASMVVPSASSPRSAEAVDGLLQRLPAMWRAATQDVTDTAVWRQLIEQVVTMRPGFGLTLASGAQEGATNLVHIPLQDPEVCQYGE